MSLAGPVNMIGAGVLAAAFSVNAAEETANFKSRAIPVQSVPRDTPRPPAVKQDAFLSLSIENHTFMRYTLFCEEHAEDCRDAEDGGQSKIRLTNQIWDLLNRVNLEVNNKVRYSADSETYGEDDFFGFPSDKIAWKGDCEDFSLLKRKMLAKHIPRSAMMLSIVHVPEEDEQTSAHAVLIVSTYRGDLVLDNRYDTIKLARDTEYKFLTANAGGGREAWKIASLPWKEDIRHAEKFGSIFLRSLNTTFAQGFPGLQLKMSHTLGAASSPFGGNTQLFSPAPR